ncbi:MAG: DUF2953 domain-containing protein [Clostridia bacterium]|nr:DUF2953 domain-containing protein [Clostridia bacterium]
MTPLYGLIGVCVLLLWLLSAKITVKIFYPFTPLLSFRFGWLGETRLHLRPALRVEGGLAGRVLERQGNKPRKEKTPKASAPPKQRELAFTAPVLKKAGRALAWVCRRFRVTLLRLDVAVGTPDAALTARRYGAVCAAVYETLGLASILTSLRTARVNITADFLSEETRVDFAMEFRTRFGFMLLFAGKLLGVWLLATKAKKKENADKGDIAE